MKAKTILILYGKDRRDKKNSLIARYEFLYKYAEKKGVTFCRAPISSFDKKQKVFKKVQFFDGKKWFFKKNIIPDIVYDKTAFYVEKKLNIIKRAISNNYLFYNSLKLSELLSNKWMTYLEFKEFSPKAVLISSKKDLGRIEKLTSEKVIIKPIAGSGGKGIKIFKKDKIRPTKYPFFCQELIEVKRGIPNFVKGAHDLRVIIINEKPFYSFLRIPEKNKLISNISQGGRVRVIPLEKMPKFVLPFINKIQKKLKKYKTKLYSIDIIIDDNEHPWIIEMNSRPGIVLEKAELPYRKYFFDNIINFFKKVQ